jgi:DNA-binding NarL/FixJ family response regulator
VSSQAPQERVSNNSIRVLLADDHRPVLETVRSVLSVDFDVVGAVENGQDAVDAVTRMAPDVLVLDITMPILNGFEVARHLTKAGSKTKIVMLTIYEDGTFVSAAFSAGACGYVTKRTLSADLVPAIHAAAEGRTFVSSSIHL